MRRKAVYNSRGNQVVDTGFKRFDKETNCISYGNIIANTIYGNYIRPYNEVKNGGYIGKPGDFLRYDMQHFDRIPQRMRAILEDKERKESYCLYEIFTHPNGNREVFGYILHDRDRRLIDSQVVCYENQNWYKRRMALDYVIDLICVEGKMEIPNVVKEYFENMESLTFVDYFKYDGKEYRLSAYHRANPDGMTDDVYIDENAKVEVYEITDEISKWDNKPKKELLDIVNVKWNYPPFVLNYRKYA
jgi:hypothetical protein